MHISNERSIRHDSLLVELIVVRLGDTLIDSGVLKMQLCLCLALNTNLYAAEPQAIVHTQDATSLLSLEKHSLTEQ